MQGRNMKLTDFAETKEYVLRNAVKNVPILAKHYENGQDSKLFEFI